MDIGTFLSVHSNKILIAVIAVCVIILLVRYRNNAAAQASMQARVSLSSARSGLGQLEIMQQMTTGEPAGLAKQRSELFGQVNATIEQVLSGASGTSDAPIRAEALIAKGDLNWIMANLPELPGATTRPELKLPNPPDSYLDSAESAYRQVISGYGDQLVSKATALLGLAAIAENRLKWSEASDDYNKLVIDDNTPRSFKAVARQRLAALPDIQVPAFSGTFSSTQPTTSPTAMAAATSGPTTQP